MAEKNQKKQKSHADRRGQTELPPGVKLLCTLEGHRDVIKSLAFDPHGDTLAGGSYDGLLHLWEVPSGKLMQTLKGHQAIATSLAFDPQGETLASGSLDATVELWETRSGKLLCTLEDHRGFVRSVAFDPKGDMLASGGDDKTVKFWEARTGRLLRTLEGHEGNIMSVAFARQGDVLASASMDWTVRLWNSRSGKLLRTLKGHRDAVYSLALHPQRDLLACGSKDSTLKLWETHSGRLLRSLEGHTSSVDIVSFSSDGRLLLSKSEDHTIRLWDCETWETLAVIPVLTAGWAPGLALHPTLSLLAAPNSLPNAPTSERDRLIHLWELDYDVLLANRTEESATTRAVHHTTGKIVLVGDHSVGKSALGHRLIHGAFKEQASSHGQQFWVFPALGKRREDDIECEAILWDFAGQPDYRLAHALFVDNADLALVLFDASDIHDPLHGVGFWLKQLQTGQSRCPIILVAAQTDRGTSPLTAEELSAFCESHGIVGPIATSSLTGRGIDELIERMKSLIPWEEKAATVTTTTFKRVKDYVLGLKEPEPESERQIIVTPEELRELLQETDAEWEFTDDEMLTAVGHLENYGYVKRLRTSKGELRILLEPERL